ncbi:HD family phosphohydrolase [Lacticaseibacillus hegangensis]|uniref:HD family phosphohydrolase n=1 Tax=Lacticaseibacillus hegangensis TaxID=2486010 RepID=A0ABW4CV85_9LACO|nr:HDIG domain-containing metalloprotein [Lacticaseibacillus hegangensis]
MQNAVKWRKSAVLVVGLLSAALIFALAWITLPKPVHVTLNTPAEETIIATQTVQDQPATAQARKAAANATAPVYSYDSTVSTKQQDQLDRLQKAMTTTENQVVSAAQKKYQDASGKDANAVYVKPTPSALTAAFRDTYAKSEYPYFYQFPDRFYRAAFALTTQERDTVFKTVVPAVERQLQGRLTDSNLASAQKAATAELSTSDLTTAQRRMGTTLIEQTIIPNQLINEAKTKAKQAEARLAVDPVEIVQGQVIVQQGQIVDRTVSHQLDVLGLTKRRAPWALFGLLLLVAIQAIALLTLLRQYPANRQRKLALLYSGLIGLSVLVMLGLRFVAKTGGANLAMLLPAALVPLLLRNFIGRRFALLAALMQTFLAFFVFYSTTGTLFTAATAISYLTSGVLAVMVQRKRLNDEAKLVAFWVVGVNLLLTLSTLLLQGARFTALATWQSLGFVVVGQVLGYVLALGATPYLEMIWQDDSVFKLNQLSDPNDPLLRDLMEKAPGTYHHSMMVASLASNAVAAIGGRTMLTRVACYYHDVGKLKKPLYFTENQPAGFDSPHNHLTAPESAAIIFAHVTDGVAMLKARHMPQFIIDICQQHHGTTLMKYFYHEAKEADPSTKESDYRYDGPKPQTIEAAVVNIADTCEAAVRSMKHPTHASIQTFVHNITNERLLDGQFDESPITVEQLRQVEASLVGGLTSTFYTRIEYPKDDAPTKGEA